jgi:hypothetical protein
MDLTLRRWRPGHLLASWAAYWVGLAGVTLGPAARACWRATHLPEGHGSISAGFGDGSVNFTVVEEGVKTFAASAPIGTVMMWLIAPPLVLWLVWLALRSRDRSAREQIGAGGVDQLGAGDPLTGAWRSRRADEVPAEQGRVRTPNP